MLRTSNAVLASLTKRDSAALRPHLKPTHLKQKTVFYEVGDLHRSGNVEVVETFRTALPVAAENNGRRLPSCLWNEVQKGAALRSMT